MEYHEISQKIHKYSEIYLYGAGIVAYGAYRAVRELFNVTVKGFLVTEKKGQPCNIDGVQVCETEELTVNKADSFIIIATPEEYHTSIEQSLRDLGFMHYMKLDSETEYALMGSYLKKASGLKLIEDYTVDSNYENRDNICVYMAVSHRDRQLACGYRNPPWVKKIQVGAALTDIRIAELTDEGSDSISFENALYGELTASYHIWKYNEYPITGLFHYRRVLDVPTDSLKLLEAGEADVVLPLPFVSTPDASGQYGRYLLPEDVEIMLQVIEEQEREAFQEIIDILKTPYLYNYNMLIARREVFEDYCSWIFPLLKEITLRCEKHKRERLPRYIGRVGEVLTSVYFMRNVRKWKIIHARKLWLV